MRELVGQSVLLAARESFGLATRDATLREPISDGSETAFELQVANLNWEQITYRLLHQNEILLEGTVACQSDEAEIPYAVLAPQLERLTREDLVRAIQQAGFERRERRTRETPLELSEPVRVALDRMDVVSQYHATRWLHQEIMLEGESTVALGALVRAYANLSQLTALCHSTMRHSFAARSVLYATRMIELYPQSPEGHWHRAYAFTLLGCNSAARADIEAAERTIDAHELPDKPPAWLSLLESAHDYDFRELERATGRGGALQELAALLWFRSVEFSDSLALTLTTGNKVLEVIPHCMRIYTGMHRVAGVSYRHFTTGISGQRFGESLAAQLSIVARQHQAVRDVVEDKIGLCSTPTGRAGLATALIEHTETGRDSGEPSVSVLGRMIEEFNVLHISERAIFLRDNLGVDAGGFLDSVRPAFEQHPLAPLVEVCRHRERSAQPEVQQTLNEFEIYDVNWISMYWLLFQRVQHGTTFKNTSRNELLLVAREQQSKADVDLLYLLDFTEVEQWVRMAKQLAALGSQSPKVYAVLIDHDWENSQKDAEDWADRYGQHPAIAIALAKRFGRAADYDRAVALLKGCLQTAPDFTASRGLITIYFAQGLHEEALKTAEDVLAGEDFSLDHAQLSKMIAYTLIAEGKLEEAIPWAERSAASGAGWGIKVLADCYEAMGKLDEADQLLEQIDRRYASYFLYQFRARRGTGDLEGAYALKIRGDQRRYAGSDLVQRMNKVFHAAVLRDQAAALEGYRKAYEEFKYWYFALMIAALADFEDDAELRDQVLADVANAQPAERENLTYFELAKALKQAHESGELDTARIDELADRMNPEVNYFAGCYFDAREDRKRAIEYYKKAARGPLAVRYPGGRNPEDAFVLSWLRLRELGERPTFVPTDIGFAKEDTQASDTSGKR